MKIRHTSLETDNKIDKLQTVKDQIRFNEKRADIFSDLSQIRYQVTEKVRNCSR